MCSERLGSRVLLTGWGRTAPSAATVVRPGTESEVAALLADPPPRGIIARGMGRSYGDAAQDAGGLVVDGAGLEPRVEIDPGQGLVTASASVTVDRLLRELVPRGWFVPVTPGTRQVSVGGAVAADIHGKNHPVDGSFGSALTALRLVLPGGEAVAVGPDIDPELFWATVGGLGLTGIVTEATFRLLPIETARMRVDTRRARNLGEALELMAGGAGSPRYAVAWIDLLARGGSMGRSVLGRADHARPEDLPARARPDPLAYDPHARLAGPPWAPQGLLNRGTVRAFNAAWFHRAPADRRGEVVSIPSYFHPLDAVAGWNRLYGARGLVQYQCVVPLGAEDALRSVVTTLSGARVPSFLGVLKRFGPGNPGPLSFPMPGWTLSLDMPAGRPGLARLLRNLDELVAAAGGRVYLAKDAVLRADLVPVMYPELARWRSVRDRVDPDRVLRSDLSRRLDL